jgi:hypothetical protein
MTGVAPLREVRQLAATAAAAEDAALLRLVRLLDSLPARGEADRVLDPVRPRLQALKPQRPLRFARLLFLPLDGAIVPPQQWRRGGHEVPRSALAPIAAAVAATLGPAAATLEREAEGHSTEDDAVIAALGATLWPAAAEALPTGPPPAWADTGLSRDDYASVRAVIAPVLAAGGAIFAALREGMLGPPMERVRAALAGPAEAGPLPLAAAMATLLRRAAAPGRVLVVAGEFGAPGRAVGTRMIDAAMDRLPDPGAMSLRDAAPVAARLFAGIADLEACGLLDPDRSRRLAQMRHAADEACRRRIAETGAAQVAGTLATLRTGGAVSDEALAEVERDARAIRALAQVGRGVGDPAAYDRALRGLAETVGQLGAQPGGAGPDGLGPIDIARVVEIIAGPDAAEAVLKRALAGQPL